MNVLSQDFFGRDTCLVARELLGKVIYHRIDNVLFKAVISETEAYHGVDDLGCHCSKGKTSRTSVMFGTPGYFYVYLIYGMYEMLNIVTMPEDFPAAVLIRGVRNLEKSTNTKHFEKLDVKTDGPGKLTKHLLINRDYNQKPALPETGLWIADEGITIPQHKIQTAKRIGIDYAKQWKDKLWRFYF
jgi:DNA-3-methyladenine glycosylase